MCLNLSDNADEAIENDGLRFGVGLFVLLLLAQAYEYISYDIDIVDEELEGVLSLSEGFEAADQLLAHWAAHLRLYCPHLRVHLVDISSQL